MLMKTNASAKDAAAAVAILLLLPGSAWALSPIPVPEPGVLGLLAAAGVAGAIVWARNRRK